LCDVGRVAVKHCFKLLSFLHLSLCSDALKTDFLQFGFKNNIGTADAIFTLNSSIKHFVDKSSSVYISSLDISRAFDSVSHYKMYKSLLEAGVPVIIVDFSHNSYSKLSYAVRWNGCISAYFTAESGVRQGSCITPAIFNVFIYLFITRFRVLGVGCCISSISLVCILYAYDILLLSPTVSDLQNMLDKYAEVASILSQKFNVTKS